MAGVSPSASASGPGCRLLVGTSGYSYAEWVEAGFYPPGTPSARMLPLYARRFPVVELNYSWYQMPKAEALARLERRSPHGFCFTAKLTRTLTHEVDPSRWRDEAERYRRGVAPLLQAGRLKAVLVQLPPSFDRRAPNRRYLAALLDALSGLPLAVEFRHVSWAVDRVFEGLRRRRVSLVNVDVPRLPHLFPPLDVVTCPELFYVRFHGRNAAGWRSGNMQQQFDYSYSDAELRQWAEGPIAAMAARARCGLIFFNNHVRGQAPENARRLMAFLGLAHPGGETPWSAPSST